jgi:hypothetical protein
LKKTILPILIIGTKEFTSFGIKEARKSAEIFFHYMGIEPIIAFNPDNFELEFDNLDLSDFDVKNLEIAVYGEKMPEFPYTLREIRQSGNIHGRV